MIQEIIQNLPKTINYCNQKIQKTEESTTNILRSIIQEYKGKPIYQGDDFSKDWNIDYFENDISLYEIFNEQLEIKKNLKNIDEVVLDGKLFCFNYLDTLVCGGSQAYSDGLIDNYNFPPIDTWVWLGTHKEDSLLVAWIPNKFIALTQNGIDANPEGCIDWLNEWYPEIEVEIIKTIHNTI